MVSSFNKITEGVFKIENWLSDQTRGRNKGQNYDLGEIRREIAGSDFSVISLNEEQTDGRVQILAKKEEYMDSVRQKMFIPSKGQYPVFVSALDMIENGVLQKEMKGQNIHGQIVYCLNKYPQMSLDRLEYDEALDLYREALNHQFDDIKEVNFSKSVMFILDEQAIFSLIEIDKSSANEICPFFINPCDNKGLQEALSDLIYKNEHNFTVSGEGKQTKTGELLESMKEEIKDSEWPRVRKELGINGTIEVFENLGFSQD